MYQFERFIGDLKKKVRNKARVEASIVAYLVEEATLFLSLYFRAGVRSARNKTPRYDENGPSNDSSCTIDFFQYQGRYTNTQGSRILKPDEYKAAALYILTNIPEMYDFFVKFQKEEWKSIRVEPNDKHRRDLRLNGWKIGRGKRNGPNFFDWFRNECMKTSGIDNCLSELSYGFLRKVTSYGIYDINGYRFRSEKYENKRSGNASINSGVCVSCTDDEDNVTEYYGVIEDIIKIKWEGSMQLELVLFDCRWFNPTTGVRRSPNLGLVEIKRTSRLQTNEPFVLASQVTQVYYLSYACKTRSDLIYWQVVYHVPPRGYV
ncbi:uncharacterized protein LOC104584415 isoform X2 [Brachypodium distachyon]|uniref:uncharacterized protein LOC104584415 isoform X2 n=1 Tax=Brachypodium distachyon TaxID=15368 RepID=UPI00071C50F0|nr:uncharacterized protein LOC104584415 isoform X2 [Brachypodium distachyon]XP_024319431.1 uncharacterized protein LOC104584415 isoform X2 [Brachypodium distachyon]|eukprot:XP_014757405.1 uncharacterized protein LOC104584415 isoform X2 [Brachypodium distachyon]